MITAPPILTLQLELGNLRKENKNDFFYNDFSAYMGKKIFFIYHKLF